MMFFLVVTKAPFVYLHEKLGQLLDKFRLHEEIFHVVMYTAIHTLP